MSWSRSADINPSPAGGRPTGCRRCDDCLAPPRDDNHIETKHVGLEFNSCQVRPLLTGGNQRSRSGCMLFVPDDSHSFAQTNGVGTFGAAPHVQTVGRPAPTRREISPYRLGSRYFWRNAAYARGILKRHFEFAKMVPGNKIMPKGGNRELWS